MLPIEKKEDNVTNSRGRIYAKEINAIYNELKNIISVKYTLTENDPHQLLKAIETISKSSYYKDYSLNPGVINLKRDLSANRVEEYNSGNVYYFSVTNEKDDKFKLSINDLPLKTVVNHKGEVVKGSDLGMGEIMMAIYDGTKFFLYSVSNVDKEIKDKIKFLYDNSLRKDKNLLDVSSKVKALENLGGASKSSVDLLNDWKHSVLNGNENIPLIDNNLSDIANSAIARKNLQVYSIDQVDSFVSTLTTSIGTKLSKVNNLSDLDNIPAARNNLSVYSKSETDTKTDKIKTSVTNLDKNKLSKVNNLSDLDNIPAARNNLSVYSKSETDLTFTNIDLELDKINNTIDDFTEFNSITKSHMLDIIKDKNINKQYFKLLFKKSLEMEDLVIYKY